MKHFLVQKCWPSEEYVHLYALSAWSGLYVDALLQGRQTWIHSGPELKNWVQVEG